MVKRSLSRLLGLALLASGFLAVAASPAVAQTNRTPKGFIAFGGGQQSKTPDFSERRVFTLYAEDAVAEARYGGKGGSLFDISAGVLVWRQLLVGAAFTGSSYSHSADVNASLPHPFFFNTARLVDGTASSLDRKESAVHIPVMWQVRATPKVDVMLFAGPSFVSASQDFVDTVEIDEQYPFDTATFRTATVREVKVSKTVPHFGAAVAYRLTNRLAVGAQVRQAGKKVNFELESGRTVNVKIGGTQFTGGIWLGL